MEIIAHHDGITRGDIMDLLYADDPNGGALNMNVVSVLCSQVNKQLIPQGYKITSSLGHGALFRLVKLNGNPKRKPSRHTYARTVEGLKPAVTTRVDRF